MKFCSTSYFGKALPIEANIFNSMVTFKKFVEKLLERFVLHLQKFLQALHKA